MSYMICINSICSTWPGFAEDAPDRFGGDRIADAGVFFGIPKL